MPFIPPSNPKHSTQPRSLVSNGVAWNRIRHTAE